MLRVVSSSTVGQRKEQLQQKTGIRRRTWSRPWPLCPRAFPWSPMLAKVGTGSSGAAALPAVMPTASPTVSRPLASSRPGSHLTGSSRPLPGLHWPSFRDSCLVPGCLKMLHPRRSSHVQSTVSRLLLVLFHLPWDQGPSLSPLHQAPGPIQGPGLPHLGSSPPRLFPRATSDLCSHFPHGGTLKDWFIPSIMYIPMCNCFSTRLFDTRLSPSLH